MPKKNDINISDEIQKAIELLRRDTDMSAKHKKKFDDCVIMLTQPDSVIFSALNNDIHADKRKIDLKFHPDIGTTRQVTDANKPFNDAFRLVATAAFQKLRNLRELYPEGETPVPIDIVKEGLLVKIKQAIENNGASSPDSVELNTGTQSVPDLHLRIFVSDPKTKGGIEKALKEAGIPYQEYVKNNVPMLVINDPPARVINHPNFASDLRHVIREESSPVAKASSPMQQSAIMVDLIDRLSQSMMFDAMRSGVSVMAQQEELLNQFKQCPDFQSLKSLCAKVSPSLNGDFNFKVRTFVSTAARLENMAQLEKKLDFLPASVRFPADLAAVRAAKSIPTPMNQSAVMADLIDRLSQSMMFDAMRGGVRVMAQQEELMNQFKQCPDFQSLKSLCAKISLSLNDDFNFKVQTFVNTVARLENMAQLEKKLDFLPKSVRFPVTPEASPLHDLTPENMQNVRNLFVSLFQETGLTNHYRMKSSDEGSFSIRESTGNPPSSDQKAAFSVLMDKLSSNDTIKFSKGNQQYAGPSGLKIEVLTFIVTKIDLSKAKQAELKAVLNGARQEKGPMNEGPDTNYANGASK